MGRANKTSLLRQLLRPPQDCCRLRPLTRPARVHYPDRMFWTLTLYAWPILCVGQTLTGASRLLDHVRCWRSSLAHSSRTTHVVVVVVGDSITSRLMRAVECRRLSVYARISSAIHGTAVPPTDGPPVAGSEAVIPAAAMPADVAAPDAGGSTSPVGRTVGRSVRRSPHPAILPAESQSNRKQC
jgi:hypothetical protein